MRASASAVGPATPPDPGTFGALAQRLAGEDGPVAVLDDLDRWMGDEAGKSTLEQRLDVVVDRLGLDALEAAVLAAVALRDVSPQLGAALSGLGPPAPSGAATPRAVARLLSGPGVSVADILVSLEPAEALRASGAVRVIPGPEGTAPADRGLACADVIAGVLLGAGICDDGPLRRVEPSPLPFGRPEAIAAIAATLEQDAAGRPPLAVHGTDAPLAVAEAGGCGLVCVAAAEIGDPELVADARLIAALEQRTLVVDRLGAPAPAERVALADRLVRGVPGALLCLEGPDELIALEHVPALTVAVGLPDREERAAIWLAALGTVAPQRISAMHRLPLGRIADAARLARAAAGAAGRAEPDVTDVESGARAASTSSLGEVARAMAPDIGWEDLVLPDRAIGLLRSLVAFLRHRDLVLDEWGFGRRAGRAQGMIAMFAGESGTGKTLAARVLAAELGLELFRIDLATVVSKWLGETEKNLERVFAAAEGANAVLFFDEADAVFGRRSDVQDSHDRYANLQTSFLLQRIERHEGPVLLATNMRGNIDEAFLRRMDAVVEFPFPTAEHRRRLWELLIPDDAPCSEDVDLDFLSERFELAGGGIRNAALAGAVLAAEDGEEIGMGHLVRGVGMEYAKLGRLTLAADFDRYHDLVRTGKDR